MKKITVAWVTSNGNRNYLYSYVLLTKIFCQDYDAFDLANEIDELDKFLKISASVSTAEIVLENSDTTKSQIVVENGELNGNPSSREVSYSL